MTSLHRVFVYGTLKRGQPNHPLLQDASKGRARLLGAAVLVRMFPLVVASRWNIPCLLHAEGRGERVHGEVYEVDLEMLGHLDHLEGHPDFYTRLPTECSLADKSHDSVLQSHDTSNPGKALESPDPKPDSQPSTMSCEAYFLQGFREELLSLPHISDYSCVSSQHGTFLMGADRDPSYDYKGAMKQS